MSIFSLMRSLSSKFIISLLFFFITAAYPIDFQNNYRNLILYSKDEALTNYLIADAIFFNKFNFQLLNKITSKRIDFKISEFYYEQFHKKNKFLLGKKKNYSGNSLFFNVSDIPRLYEGGNNSYPDSMKRVDELGVLEASYTRLLNNGSMGIFYYPEKKTFKLSISSEFINQNASFDLSLYGVGTHVGMGLNMSKIIGGASMVYLEASYINKLVFEQHMRQDNLYIIPGFQYTLNNGITLNIEYLYHNNDITVDDIIRSQGKIKSKNLDYLATKSQVVFFNIGKIMLSENLDLMLSLIASKKHKIKNISATIKNDVNDSVSLYGKLTKKAKKKGLDFFVGIEYFF